MTPAELKAFLQNSINELNDDGGERKKKAINSFKSFILLYFSHHLGLQDNARFDDVSIFRNFVYKNLDKEIKNNRRILLEAYRGAAKTTIISRLYSLWCLLSGRKDYCVIIGASSENINETSETLRTELENNSRLIYDFKIRTGLKWTNDNFDFICETGSKKYRFYGVKKAIRGANFQGKRPDLIICDDIEKDENVLSKDQRDKLEAWFNRAVAKLPARQNNSYNIIVVGTRLHYDGLLARLKNSPAFKSWNFPLVIEFPKNLDEISAKNLEKADLKSFKIDDEKLNKIEILGEYFENKEAFYSEYQNEPLSREGLIFGEFKTFEVMPECETYYIGVDPALGKAKGDYFALTLLGRKENIFYASSQGYKIKPDEMIKKIIALYLRYINHAPTIAIETIAFQEFFKDRLKAEALKRGIYLRTKELKNKIAKELRLDALSPYINDGTISIDENSHLLIDELQTYPKSSHDDLLDSLEMAFRIASTASLADYKAINRLISKKTKLFKRAFL